MKKNAGLTVILLLSLVLAGCNFPPPADVSPEQVATSAAQTVMAEIALQEGQPDSDQVPDQPQPEDPDEVQPATDTPEPLPPTETPTPTETIPEGCIDRAVYVADVTIPDDTVLPPNADFDKTWRIRNDGTCTWTSSYALVFRSGDAMGAASVIPLTGVVPPGSSVDITVDMTAPSAEGTYQGFWDMRNGDGVVFRFGTGGTYSIYTRIIVQEEAPTPTPGILLIPTGMLQVTFVPIIPSLNTVTLTAIEAESGTITSNGGIYSSIRNVGDTNTNLGTQVFLSYDMSSIPLGASITSVVVDFGDYDTLGNPFGSLGALRAYAQQYGTLSSGDYVHGSVSTAIGRWSNEGQLESGGSTTYLPNAVANRVGTSRFQMRLQFNEVETDNDGTSDMARFDLPQLIVTYDLP